MFSLLVVLLLFTENFILMMSAYIAQYFWAFLDSSLCVIYLLWIFDIWHCVKKNINILRRTVCISTVNSTLKQSRSLLLIQRFGSFAFLNFPFFILKNMLNVQFVFMWTVLFTNSLHGGRKHRQHCSKNHSGDTISDNNVIRLLWREM